MREVGALLDAKALHGGRRAFDHLLCLACSNGIPRSRVKEVLRVVGLEGVARRRVEYSSGMIRTSLIAVPKRGRVLAAKSLVFAGVTFVVGEVVCFAAFLAGQALISGHAPTAALGDPGVIRAVAGGGLLLTAMAVLSVVAGALLRHPAAAIAAIVYAIAWTLLDRRDA
ncbi:MAG TPA: hypothetical protein VMR14_25740 [Streptosporangiaceae bacterium]|jgi:hypothetical protein|nr:hypothetical protein [Streptosporangiaceae bacterium]